MTDVRVHALRHDAYFVAALSGNVVTCSNWLCLLTQRSFKLLDRPLEPLLATSYRVRRRTAADL